ncbi:tyrosine-protein phosphatase [Streptomyces sp. NPDC088354]|uniref:tyrosine-protein phosphatase n=1 Tax=unclassified Streptomyces TaxID=2593676 RepID=UPI0029B09BBF|nr:tyrosine-protein phosphatase [Streptomyces sp. MI02-7b]MDX3071348.1 tyrosine-protein phosphatase [Streptomyces sp. MI02-7b]
MEATHDGPPGGAARWVELAEVDNIRDLGGLPVHGGGRTRRGVVFRASTLQDATADDVELLLGRYRLRTVVDLRGPDEAAREGHGLLADTPVRRVSLPVRRVQAAVTDAVPAVRGEAVDDTAGFYEGLLDGSGASLVDAARIVADTDQHAVVFHCAVGKDRTGVLAALLLDAVGVPADAIAADYALTAQRVARIRERLARLPSYRDLPAVEHHYMASKPQVMHHFLDTLRTRHGGAGRWLRERGLTGAELGRLKGALVSGPEG